MSQLAPALPCRKNALERLYNVCALSYLLFQLNFLEGPYRALTTFANPTPSRALNTLFDDAGLASTADLSVVDVLATYCTAIEYSTGFSVLLLSVACARHS